MVVDGKGNVYTAMLRLADYCTPLALRAVADLGVADAIGSESRPVTDLAALLGVSVDALGRSLRALAAQGVFDEESDGVFANTDLSQLLRSDHPFSMRESLALIPAQVQAWARIDYSLATGRPAFDEVHGLTEWDFLERDRGQGKKFDQSMRSMNRLLVRSLARAYPWTELETVVDLGGGSGGFLFGLLTQQPRLRGVLFDQSWVVALAMESAAAMGVADRVQIVSGDLLTTVPASFRGYLLKLVLHALDDRECVRVLSGIAEVMAPDGRVLIIESLLGGQVTDAATRIMDLQMLVTTGGRERSIEDFGRLAGEAGLVISNVVVGRLMPIVEFRRG